MEESWTILAVLQWTAGYFARKGIEQARANAEVLLAHILGVERIQLYLRYDQPLSPEELARFRRAVQRRSTREPAQYITGKQEFWSLDFEVNSAVLIPRPETELLVEKALELLPSSPSKVLDLCTGSGAIAVALASERSDLRIFATDRSPEALVVAKRNAVRHGVQDRIHFAAADLFNGLSPGQPPFDLIVSNPPYIGDVEMPGLAPEILQYEPQAALRGGGPLGLDIIGKILDAMPSYLRPGGTLLVEIGQGQAGPLREMLDGKPPLEVVEFIKDYSGILRILYLRRTDR